MNREQKAAAIAEIAEEIREAHAVFAVDPTGLTVSESAAVRAQLRAAGARLRVVKNTLTERAADEAGVEELKALLDGPTALTFVRGDAAAAAKALADYARVTDRLPFKGGLMEGAPLDVAQIQAIARLPSRDVLYGQLVGLVASPISGLARGLNALLSGVAIALGQVREKAEAGEIQLGGGAGEPAAQAEAAPAEPQGAPAVPSADGEPEPAAGEPAPEEEAEAAPATDEPGDQDAEPPTKPVSAEEPAEGPAEDATNDNDEE